MNRAILVAAAIIWFPSSASAETYEISVTRKDSNLYKVDGQEIYIKTRYCYEYAYSQRAILIIDSPGGFNIGKILFVASSGSGNQCDVEKVLS